MLRLIALLLSMACLVSAGKPHDREALIAKLQRDLDRAMLRGTPTDKEIAILKKSRQDLTSANNDEVSDAVNNIDRIAHTQSFKSQDASDVRKDIGNIRGHKSLLFIPLP